MRQLSALAFFLVFSVLSSCASLGPQSETSRCVASSAGCSAVFADALSEQEIEERRLKIYVAIREGNLRFPQIDNGINLAALAAFFINPIPEAELAKPPSESEIDNQFEAMKRAHVAFGIEMKVPREKVVEVSEYFRNGLVRKLHMLVHFEDMALADASKSSKVDRFFFAQDPSLRLQMARLGVRINKVLESAEARDAGLKLRESLRGGQDPREPRSEAARSLKAAVVKELEHDAELKKFIPFLVGFN